MPYHLHTAQPSHYSSTKLPSPSPLSPSSRPSTLTRRGNTGSTTTTTIIIIAGLIVGIILTLFLLQWARNSHAKETARRQAHGQRLGWRRPGRRAGTRHGDGSGSGRSRKPCEGSGGHLADDDCELEPPPNAFRRGDAPPSYRSKPDFSQPDLKPPGPSYGYAGKDGRVHRAQSVADYMSECGNHCSRLGAPSCQEYFGGR
ncbi:hypothetical protein LTR08_003088 [Meristemomyces frigidus]|nr:hypothetical protein LTR08_003088 [Meristemomyces frigidus]